jgi:hypothetical protein
MPKNSLDFDQIMINLTHQASLLNITIGKIKDFLAMILAYLCYNLRYGIVKEEHWKLWTSFWRNLDKILKLNDLDGTSKSLEKFKNANHFNSQMEHFDKLQGLFHQFTPEFYSSLKIEGLSDLSSVLVKVRKLLNFKEQHVYLMSKICKYLERYELYQEIVFKFLPSCFPEYTVKNIIRSIETSPKNGI